MTAYIHKPWPVNAVQWTGSNRDEVKAFFADRFDEVDGPYFSADEESGEPFDNYNTVQFYAWGDDQEVDPERWIVVHGEGATPGGEIMLDDEFRMAYGPAAEPSVTA